MRKSVMLLSALCALAFAASAHADVQPKKSKCAYSAGAESELGALALVPLAGLGVLWLRRARALRLPGERCAPREPR